MFASGQSRHLELCLDFKNALTATAGKFPSIMDDARGNKLREAMRNLKKKGGKVVCMKHERKSVSACVSLCVYVCVMYHTLPLPSRAYYNQLRAWGFRE